jgi:hypothetical protein
MAQCPYQISRKLVSLFKGLNGWTHRQHGYIIRLLLSLKEEKSSKNDVKLVMMFADIWKLHLLV